KLRGCSRGPAQAECNNQKQESAKAFRFLLAHLRFSLAGSPRKSKPVVAKKTNVSFGNCGVCWNQERHFARPLLECALCVVFFHFCFRCSLAHLSRPSCGKC